MISSIFVLLTVALCLWLLYTSGFGVALRCVLIFGLCPSEFRGPLLAMFAALAQESGEVKVSETLEDLAGKVPPSGRWTSIKIEVASKASMGFGLAGKAREDAINKPHDEL